MKKVAMAQRKGGVSKSTLAILLAAAATGADKQAVIVELDKQGTASLWNDKRGKDAKPKVMRIEGTALEAPCRSSTGSASISC